MQFDEKLWSDIIKQAMTLGLADGKGVVAGARLRTLVDSVAKERGVNYPPAGREGWKFGRLIADFEAKGLLAVRSRPGHDFLVALAERAEALVSPIATSGGSAGIRTDLFQAFTTLTPKKAFYLPQDDSVIWLAESESTSEGAVRIDQPSLTNLIDERRSFIAALKDPEAQEELTASLAAIRPIAAFSQRCRTHGLQREWHQFRLNHLVEKITAWAQHHQLPWQPTWITDSARGDIERPGPRGAANEWRQQLGYLLESVERDDLSRITVPLDLVLKLLARGR